MSQDPVTMEALRLEVARLEAENQGLRRNPGPAGPMGPPGPPGPAGPYVNDPMTSTRHAEIAMILNRIAGAAERIANALEGDQ